MKTKCRRLWINEKKNYSMVSQEDSQFFFDLVDEYLKRSYGLSDAELAFIFENIEDSDVEDFISIVSTNQVSFSDKKRAIGIKQKYMKMLYEN